MKCPTCDGTGTCYSMHPELGTDARCPECKGKGEIV